MDDILSRFSINCHSSIRYAGAMTVWFDPFRVADAPCDADVVFVTHDHYDHFSPEDIRRVMKPGAVLVLPETCVAAALRAGFASAQLLPVRPGEAYTVQGLPFTAVPAYNLDKPFHPRGTAGWAMWSRWRAGGSMWPAIPTIPPMHGPCRVTSPSCRWAAPTP